MEMKTIEILSSDKLRILKQIMIVSQLSNNRDISIGYILYERYLSNEYKFTEKPKEEKDIDYYMDFPKQKTFPKDAIDDIILQAIKNTYPLSFVINHSILTNIDEERIPFFKNRHIEPGIITFSPNFSYMDFVSLAGKQFPTLNKNISIYNNYIRESIENLFFIGYYELNDSELFEKLKKINFF